MKQDSKLRQYWSQLKLSPFVSPMLIGWAVLALLLPPIGADLYTAVLLWTAAWAVLEHIAPKGHPRGWVRILTPNFYAVRGLDGCWRIFQRRPESKREGCRQLLKDLLRDQCRLPEALEPGLYRALTHETILARLKGMGNVAVLSSSPAYVATLEDTINQAMGRKCGRCSDRCPFPGRQTLRQFYDVRFLVKETAAPSGGEI